MQFAVFIHHKWPVRFFLLCFWIIAAIKAYFGEGFVMWMLNEHTYISLVVVTLSIYYLISPFYAPFCKIKKRTQGGDVLMERSTKVLLVIIAVMGSLITVLFFSPSARETIIKGANNSVAKPLMGAWLGFVNRLDSIRGIYLLSSGIVTGIFLAVLVKIAVPKVRQKTPSISMKRPITLQREPLEPESAPIRQKSQPIEPTPPPPATEEPIEMEA